MFSPNSYWIFIKTLKASALIARLKKSIFTAVKRWAINTNKTYITQHCPEYGVFKNAIWTSSISTGYSLTPAGCEVNTNKSSFTLVFGQICLKLSFISFCPALTKTLAGNENFPLFFSPENSAL